MILLFFTVSKRYFSAFFQNVQKVNFRGKRLCKGENPKVIFRQTQPTHPHQSRGTLLFPSPSLQRDRLRDNTLPPTGTKKRAVSNRNYILVWVFFLKFLADTCPFLGPLVPLFGISGDVSSGFQSQSGLPYLHCRGERNVCSLRSTSGATLADLLVAGTQPVLSSHTVADVRLRDSNSCSQNICEPDTLPTELNRDRHCVGFYSFWWT